jgi:putative PEP-CTERM system histidine kinase
LTSSWYSIPGVWSYGIAALAFAWLAVRLLAQWQPGGKPAMLLALAGTTSVAAAAAVAFVTVPSVGTWWSAWALDLLRSAAILGFLLAFLGVRDRGKGAQRGGKGWAVLVTLGLVLLLAQLVLGIKAPGVPDLGRTVHQLGFASGLAIAVFGLVLVEQCYRRTPATSRWHVRPLLLGLAGVLGFDLVLYADALLFRELDVDLWSARGLAQAITVPMMLLTLQRARDWSFELSLSRGVLVGSTALLGTGAYLVLISGAGFLLRQFGGSWGRALESALVFAALLLLAMVGMSATFRAKVRVLVAKNFFTYRYDYRQEWLRFTNTLASGAAGQPWAACVQALGDLVESPGGALWLNDGKGAFLQVVHSTLPQDRAVIAVTDALPAFLRRFGWVLEISNVIAQSSKYENLTLPASIAGAREAWLIVPLRTTDDLVGFVVLSEPRVRIDLDWEVRDLLKTAGRQAGSYLAYAQATEALLEARKFDAFHRMSTFVVHDLKNLIAQLQLLLSNVERHRDNPDFQRDMLKTIEHVVGRMHQLTLQLRPEGSATDPPRPVDVGAVIRRIQSLGAGARSALRVEAGEGILAWAHDDLLERVISHLVQNAFDASESQPDVRVQVQREGNAVVIEVSDRGKGMTPDFIRDRLFRPFQTTKDSGMGIGAFECQQYAQRVGGRIEVESSPEQGTCMRLRLRAVEPARSAGEVAA